MRSQLFLRRFLLVGALLLFGATAARAHAFLDHAAPAVGSTVKQAPQQVTIWFTEGVEPAFSRITVENAAGQRVDKGHVRRDPKNESELEVALGPLPPGTYTVGWHVVSVDTHRTQGHFTFTVAPG